MEDNMKYGWKELGKETPPKENSKVMVIYNNGMIDSIDAARMQEGYYIEPHTSLMVTHWIQFPPHPYTVEYRGLSSDAFIGENKWDIDDGIWFTTSQWLPIDVGVKVIVALSDGKVRLMDAGLFTSGLEAMI